MYQTPDDFSHFTFFKVLAIIIAIVYGLVLFYLIIRSLSEIRRLSKPFRFIFSLSLLTIFVTILGVSLGSMSPLPVNKVDFLSFYALYNLYVYILAFAYSPSGRVREDNYQNQQDEGGNIVDEEQIELTDRE